jgi:P-type Cu2+ transporter
VHAVNYASASLNVEYLPNLVKPEDMQEALQSVGYDILIETGAGTSNNLEELGQNKYKKLKLRTIGAILFSMPVVIIGMFFMNMPFANEIMWALSTPVILLFGKDFYINAWKQAKHRVANMDTLGGFKHRCGLYL